jgi:hypothetical protein
MSAANPNPMEKSMVSVLVVANAGGGSPLLCDGPVIASTSAKPKPPPDGPATQDIPLPDAPMTAPVETEGWKTMEGKAIQRKKKNAEVDKKQAKEVHDKTPTTKNSGRGKNSHQPRLNTTSGKKTWAAVVKSGGINVQIVLGNGNLGLTTPTMKRGERRGGAVWRLMKRGENGERGTMGRGKGGPEEIISRGNKGGQMGKSRRGREEDREEPGVAASEQTGLLDKTTRG